MWLPAGGLLLLGGTRLAAAACPAGQGQLPGEDVCAECPEGTWSPEGNISCTRCPAGSWGARRGAAEPSACVACGPGTWSSQEGATSLGACRACPPGRWSERRGLSELTACTACPAGHWSSSAGATEPGVCTACVPGKFSSLEGQGSEAACRNCSAGRWSGEAGASRLESCAPCQAGTWSRTVGASSADVCVACEPGKWSDTQGAQAEATCSVCMQGRFGNLSGASAPSDCAACPPGTWSQALGASGPGACRPCRPGTYQPISMAADQSLCLPCAAGSYSSGEGASDCRACRPGSWSSARGASACMACPAGTWSHSPGAERAEFCADCAAECLAGSDALVAVELRGLAQSELTGQQRASLTQAYAQAIALACGVSPASVRDLGNRSASSSFAEGQGTRVVCLVAVPANSSVNALGLLLGSVQLREALLSSASSVVEGTAAERGPLAIEDVVVQPLAFAELPAPVTFATTSSTVAPTEQVTPKPLEATGDLPLLHPREGAAPTQPPPALTTAGPRLSLGAEEWMGLGWLLLLISMALVFSCWKVGVKLWQRHRWVSARAVQKTDKPGPASTVEV